VKKISKLEVSEICNQLGESFPKNISQIYGGDINNSFKLDFQNYSIFLKKNIRKEKLLKYEYFCLKNLEIYNNTDDLIIPKINSYISLENTELLLMEWIDIENGSQLKLGKGLAEMHLRSNQSNQNKFGYEVEGFIGINKQMAGWGSNWADFFVNFRIKPQLKNLKRDFYNSNLLKNLISKIKTVLNQHDPTISLVHGDLWSGNFGINKDAKGVIFDPASWWADSEVDLAMTKLFGGFNHEFYQEYYKIIPMKSGFEKRLVIYNLYHVLNHANIFGGSYITQADEYMKIILDM
tara:strand:+ start:7590 stop:8468 length:879 start_codon:yes stop_codon:yes gene_type:complete